MTEDQMTELELRLRDLIRRPVTKWERGFIASVLRQMRRRGWFPSQKQMRVLDRIIADDVRRTYPETDPLIDHEEGGRRALRLA